MSHCHHRYRRHLQIVCVLSIFPITFLRLSWGPRSLETQESPLQLSELVLPGPLKGSWDAPPGAPLRVRGAAASLPRLLCLSPPLLSFLWPPSHCGPSDQAWPTPKRKAPLLPGDGGGDSCGPSGVRTTLWHRPLRSTAGGPACVTPLSPVKKDKHACATSCPFQSYEMKACVPPKRSVDQPQGPCGRTR